MSTPPIAAYSFLPWLRQGIANQITAADHAADVKVRATIQVALELAGAMGQGTPITHPINKPVELYGPGDIVGIESRAIVRTDPRDWVTNFENNYLPFVEFYDEDFPWRYTPAAPDASNTRLRPWITLVILRKDETADEFDEGAAGLARPLPFIQLKETAAALFPPADQLWAWAHVHVNRSLASTIVSTDMGTVLPAFAAVLNSNPDLACSRLLCPRRLDANAAYYAFLMPTFESGRLAGLGLDVANVPNATHSAWEDYPNRPEPANYPVYYRWFFRTGSIGDFEYLVRLLQPKPVDKRVGTRDMDVQTPGSNVPGISDPRLGGVLRLGGALRVPLDSMGPTDRVDVQKFDRWFDPFPHPFERALASLINLADDYAGTTASNANKATNLPPAIKNNPDPVITPPLYARWHALASRLLHNRDRSPIPSNQNWVHELNLDPRFRVAAGFGTRVIQDKQEEYVNAAWEQIGDVLEANRRIRFAQLARETACIWHERHLTPLCAKQPEKFFQITAPLQKRVVTQGTTVFQQVRTSHVQPAPVSGAFRRMARPNARLATSLQFQPTAPPALAISRINAGQISAAPPKQAPSGVMTVEQATGVLRTGSAVSDGARKVIKAFVGRSIDIKQLPASPDFRIAAPGSNISPKAGTQDSGEAKLFKTALQDTNAMLAASETAGALPARIGLDVTVLSGTTLQALHPDITVRRALFNGIQLPPRVIPVVGEELREVMAYPVIDLPMFKPLTERSPELFLPNINLIEHNNITLLETNQKFIEAYMVGLNHEFARELLWREYPTDMRGTYFRQFWEVSTFFDTGTLTGEDLKEKLRDIPPIDRWAAASGLGDHDNREIGGANEQELVLVIRGELLKKYPTAVIYAQKAQWQLAPDGTVDTSVERRLVDLTDAELDKPPRDKLKTPLYQSQVAPDIFFLGFDLTALEARGDIGDYPDKDQAGWFFVIKERPGDPRFGLDLNRDGQLNDWNDLAWSDVAPGANAGDFLQIKNDTATIQLVEPTGDVAEKHDQWVDDKNVSWTKDASSADLAYVLFQAPVLIAVHASEMLPR